MKFKVLLSIVISVLFGLSAVLNAFQGPAYKAYLKGLLAMQSGDLAGAIGEYNRVLSMDENAVPVYRDLAYAYWRAGDRYKAIESAQKLKEFYGKDLYTQLFLGSFFMMMGQSDEAKTAWESALKIDPNNETAVLYLAAYNSANNNPKEAIEYWDKYIRLKPESAESYYQRGIAFERLGQQEKAIQSLEKTITLKPESYEAYFALAQLYEKQERLEDAIRECEKYLEYIPDNVTILLYLGGLYYRARNYEAAENIFEKADKINPNDPTIMFWLGILAEEKKDWAGAITYFEVLREKEETSMLLARLSYYYSLNSQHSKAISYLKKAIELEPRNPNLYYLLGLAYGDVKNYKLARQNFNEALKIKPDFVDAYFRLGIMFDQWGKFDEAVPYLEKAIEIDSNYSRAMNYLGYSYAEKEKNLEKAQELVEKALLIEPDNPAYIDSLGWVYFKQNKYDEAEILLEKASEKMSDSVIYGHLGDVKSKLDKKIEAWIAYKSASDFDPENKEISEKVKELEDIMGEDALQKAEIQKIVKMYGKADSLKCDFFLKGEKDSYNFAFTGSCEYLKPGMWKVNILGGVLNAELTIVYNKELKFFPEALEQHLPDELKKVFLGEIISFQEFVSENTSFSRKGKYFYYETGHKVLKVDRKKALPVELAIKNDITIYFTDFFFKNVAYFPKKMQFVIKNEIRGDIFLEKYELNKSIEASSFNTEK